MTGASGRVLAVDWRRLDTIDPVVTFPTTGGGGGAVWDRFLAVNGVNAYAIGNVCGTCPFWFERQGQSVPIEMADLRARLAVGIETTDDPIVDRFASLLPDGAYAVALLEIAPQRVTPGSAEDYFTHELWQGWSDPDSEDPGTDYYRLRHGDALSTPIGPDLGFAFVAPLQRSLSTEGIDRYRAVIEGVARPTAVAVATLDAKQHHDSSSAHLCLIHFLLDGHHKMAAAAELGRPLTLLSFVALDHGISTAADLARFLGVPEGHPC